MRFRLSTLLWFVVVMAAFFGGRMSLQRTIQPMQAKIARLEQIKAAYVTVEKAEQNLRNTPGGYRGPPGILYPWAIAYQNTLFARQRYLKLIDPTPDGVTSNELSQVEKELRDFEKEYDH